jgi:hypothetical protein
MVFYLCVMASITIKVGDTVTVDTGACGVVTAIERSRYRIDCCPGESFTASQLKKVKPTYVLPKGGKPNPVSEKRSKQMEVYKILRDQFLKDHPKCGASLPSCLSIATEVHHMSGKEGERLNDTTEWLPICRNCHIKITEDSNHAIENGLSHRRNG